MARGWLGVVVAVLAILVTHEVAMAVSGHETGATGHHEAAQHHHPGDSSDMHESPGPGDLPMPCAAMRSVAPLVQVPSVMPVQAAMLPELASVTLVVRVPDSPDSEPPPVPGSVWRALVQVYRI